MVNPAGQGRPHRSLIRHLPETDKYIQQNSGGEDEALGKSLAQRGGRNRHPPA